MKCWSSWSKELQTLGHPPSGLSEPASRGCWQSEGRCRKGPTFPINLGAAVARCGPAFTPDISVFACRHVRVTSPDRPQSRTEASFSIQLSPYRQGGHRDLPGSQGSNAESIQRQEINIEKHECPKARCQQGVEAAECEGHARRLSNSSCWRRVPGPSLVWFYPAMAPPSCKAPCEEALNPKQWFSLT